MQCSHARGTIVSKGSTSWRYIQPITQVNAIKHVQHRLYDQVDAYLADSPFRTGQAEWSRCFRGQPPQCAWSMHISDRGDGVPEPEFPNLLQDPFSYLLLPLLTDTRKGPSQSYSKPGTQTQTPAGAEYHSQLYYHMDGFLVLKGELRKETTGSEEHQQTSSLLLWGCVAVLLHDWWGHEGTVTEGELNHARSSFCFCRPRSAVAWSFVFTQGRGVCANSDTFNLYVQINVHAFNTGQQISK